MLRGGVRMSWYTPEQRGMWCEPTNVQEWVSFACSLAIFVDDGEAADVL